MGTTVLQFQGVVFINSDHHIILKGSGPAPPNVPRRPRFLLVKPASDGFSIHTHLLCFAYVSGTTVFSQLRFPNWFIDGKNPPSSYYNSHYRNCSSLTIISMNFLLAAYRWGKRINIGWVPSSYQALCWLLYLLYLTWSSQPLFEVGVNTPCHMDEKIQAQRDAVTCLKLHS